MKQNFDLFKGEANGLIEYVESMKSKMESFEMKFVEDVTNDMMKNIQKNGMEIGQGYGNSNELNRTMDAVIGSNVIDGVNPKHKKISNSTQEATYAEFGTGMIGAGSPHALNALGWAYDVNDHGERGWRYFGVEGRLVHTLGYPAFSTYHNSFLETKDNLQYIANQTMKGVFGDAEE